MAYQLQGNLKGDTPSDERLKALILAVLKTLTWDQLKQ